jgi:glycosyltransferase involved in cell wall biosynthesis
VISVIIPAFNESKRIPIVLSDLRAFCRMYPRVISEVIVVDDGSLDSGKTIEAAMCFVSRMPLRVHRMPQNRGKWAAIHVGIDMSSNDWILLLDADGSASVFELERLHITTISSLENAVFGSRFMKASTVYGKSLVRGLLSRGYRLFVQIMLRLSVGRTDVHDSQAPWKLFRKTALSRPLRVDRFAGDFELCCSLAQNIETHPIQFSHRSGSKLHLSNVFQMFWETLKVAYNYRFKNS